MKRCNECGEAKPLTAYYKQKGNSDGRMGKCKECVKLRVREHRRKNDSVREYDRMRASLPHRVALRRRTVKRWRQENPERYKAQTKVSNALRDGKIEKEPCLFCGSHENIEAHHKDYSKPLDVMWLCAKCHKRLHAHFPETVTDGERPQA